jgi:uncharacterized protein
MFGISFAKLIVIAIVVAAVWFGFKYLKARDSQLAQARRDAEAAKGRVGRAASATEDLVKCPVCATYVSRTAGRCGRADCPSATGLGA